MKHIDWSRPAVWVFVGFGIEAIGTAIISLQHDEGGVGGFVVFSGVILTSIAIVAYLVVRARTAIAAAKEDRAGFDPPLEDPERYGPKPPGRVMPQSGGEGG